EKGAREIDTRPGAFGAAPSGQGSGFRQRNLFLPVDSAKLAGRRGGGMLSAARSWEPPTMLSSQQRRATVRAQTLGTWKSWPDLARRSRRSSGWSRCWMQGYGPA
ncbi:unnamed protein product, partial [Symbiodinium necroappetens]